MVLPNCRRIRVLLRLVAVAASIACASAGSTTAKAPAITPPEMVSKSHPNVESGVPVNTGTLMNVTVEVWIDASGIPDLQTLKITGKGANENHTAIRQWIAGSAFRPAMQSGVSVRGLFKTQLRAEVRKEVIR
jgi:hypothetical protein